MASVLPFPTTPTRKQLAWEFARTIWGSRADFPHGKQYPGIVAKIAAGFSAAQLQEAIRHAHPLLANENNPSPCT